MYCADCVKPYVREVPYRIAEDKEVVFDNGNAVQVKYKGGYYAELVVDKVCYFNKKGRHIKIKGKTYRLNEKIEL